jgi:pentatricopeptide repeat protein
MLTKLLSHLLRRDSVRRSCLLQRQRRPSGSQNYSTLCRSSVTLQRGQKLAVANPKFCSSHSTSSADFTTDNTYRPDVNPLIEEKSKDIISRRYRTALAQSSRIGDVKKIENLMIELRLKGIPPSQITYSFLVAAFAKNKDTFGAQQAFDEARLAGLTISNRMLSALLSAFANAGDPDGAERAFRDAVATGVVPGKTLHTIYCFPFLSCVLYRCKSLYPTTLAHHDCNVFTLLILLQNFVR